MMKTANRGGSEFVGGALVLVGFAACLTFPERPKDCPPAVPMALGLSALALAYIGGRRDVHAESNIELASAPITKTTTTSPHRS